MENNFSSWLLKKLEEQKMTQSELARKSKISTGQISRILSGTRGAEGKTLSAIAKALGIPTDVVFREAGLMTQELEMDALTKEGAYILERLEIEERKNAIRHLRLCLKIQEERKKGK
ncbi:MAG: helix-turn-helix transcriptional regulator [Chloroflexi bacterium]|nr:helix-turn-helix transcriptional regulator [Chloroflexota bacterium]